MSHPRACGQVTGALYSYVDPTPTGTRPYLVAGAPAVAQLISLDPRELHRPEYAASFSGNAPLPAVGVRPYSHVYGGHQFGSVRNALLDFVGSQSCIATHQVPHARSVQVCQGNYSFKIFFVTDMCLVCHMFCVPKVILTIPKFAPRGLMQRLGKYDCI